MFPAVAVIGTMLVIGVSAMASCRGGPARSVRNELTSC